MAKFKTRFSELGFYVDGSLRRFNGGVYITNDKSEIDVLNTLKDVTQAEDKSADKPVKKAPTAKK